MTYRLPAMAVAAVLGRTGVSRALAVVALLTAAASGMCADAQRRLPIVGMLWFGDSTTAGPWLDAFQVGLRELGYIDGGNLRLVSRFGHRDPERISAMVAELIALRVDILVTNSGTVKQASRATREIPIIVLGLADPVGEGYAISLARPGRNVTGVSAQSTDTTGKRFEVARELVPSMRRLALVFDPGDTTATADAEAFQRVAAGTDVRITAFPLRDSRKYEEVLTSVVRSTPDVLLVVWSPTTSVIQEIICKFAIAHRIPLVSEPESFARAGALVTFGAAELEIPRRGAVYVDRLLKGAQPGELPIEQPTKFQLVVNIKTAKAIGISVPESLLSRADKVIR